MATLHLAPVKPVGQFVGLEVVGCTLLLFSHCWPSKLAVQEQVLTPVHVPWPEHTEVLLAIVPKHNGSHAPEEPLENPCGHDLVSQLAPSNPVEQTQVFGPVHLPEPEQTAALVANTPEHATDSQLAPANPAVQVQLSGEAQTPCPEQTLALVAIMPEQIGVTHCGPPKPGPQTSRIGLVSQVDPEKPLVQLHKPGATQTPLPEHTVLLVAGILKQTGTHVLLVALATANPT